MKKTPSMRQYVLSSARVVGLLLMAAGLPGQVHAQTASWKPEKNVEIVVGTSPGGGQDRSARFVHKLIQDKRLVEVATAVINKPGGGSSIGYAYLNQHSGDGHYVMLLTVPLITNYIRGLSEISYADVSPLAVLFEEYIVAAVAANSPIKSGKELLDRLKKDPASLSIGIASVGAGGHLAVALAAKALGVDVKELKVVSFKSAGDAVTALLGGHIDAMSATTAAPVRLREAGKARILAIASPKRVGGKLADIPTWREQGVKVVFSNWRGMVGPRGLTTAQIAYWEAVFAKLAASDEFKRDVEKNQWVSNVLKSGEMRRFLKEQHDELKVVLTDLGMAK